MMTYLTTIESSLARALQPTPNAGRRWSAAIGPPTSFPLFREDDGRLLPPSCPARLARRDNVRFHANRQEAEAAGFRACLRCRPNEDGFGDQHAAAIAKAAA